MTERESHQAAKEAQRELAAEPARPTRHEEALVRFLRGMAYEETHERSERRPAGEPGDSAS